MCNSPPGSTARRRRETLCGRQGIWHPVAASLRKNSPVHSITYAKLVRVTRRKAPMLSNRRQRCRRNGSPRPRATPAPRPRGGRHRREPPGAPPTQNSKSTKRTQSQNRTLARESTEYHGRERRGESARVFSASRRLCGGDYGATPQPGRPGGPLPNERGYCNLED